MIFLLSLLTGLFGLFSFAGLGLFGLSFLGIGGGIIAWFVAKAIPWKAIALAAVVIFVVLLMGTGVAVFRANQQQLIETKVALAKEQRNSAEQKLRADTYQLDHDAQVQRIDELEKAREAILEQDQALQQQVQDMNLQQEFDLDPAKATQRLNAQSDVLNRMLHDAARPGRTSSHPAAPAR